MYEIVDPSRDYNMYPDVCMPGCMYIALILGKSVSPKSFCMLHLMNLVASERKHKICA